MNVNPLPATCLLFLLAAGGPGAAGARDAAPARDDAITPINLWQPGDPGQRIYIDGLVTDVERNPIPNATVHIRQADGNGDYHHDRYRASIVTDEDGRYAFGTVLPGQYYGVKHIHVLAEHEFFQPLETEIIFKGDPNLDRASEERAVFLEKAGGREGDVLYGRFEIMLKLPGQ